MPAAPSFPFPIPGVVRSALYRVLARWPRRRRGAARQEYALVILKFDHIGDFILATGAIRFALSRAQGRSLLIVSESVEPVARSLFPEADIIALPAFTPSITRDLLPFVSKWSRRMRSIRCRSLLHLRYQPSDYHRLIQKWIEAGREFAMEAAGYPAWREGLTLPLRSDAGLRYPKPTESYHDPAEKRIASAEIEAHRQLCEAWAGKPVSLSQVWPSLDPIAGENALPLAANALLVAPFTTDLIREIRPDHLVEALRVFRQSIPLPILIACSADETARGEALVAYAERCGLNEVRLLPCQFLPDYVATVGSARLVLSMDSATAHVAAAAGVPGVGLLGGGHFGCFAPWSKDDSFTWLNRPLPCFHCEWLCTRAENECLSAIRPGEIADALLARYQSAPRPSTAPIRPGIAETRIRPAPSPMGQGI